LVFTQPVEKLLSNIRTVEPVNAPLPVYVTSEAGIEKQVSQPPVTADLADLLLWLLEKSPGNRGNW
jgi:hypothetical protein